MTSSERYDFHNYRNTAEGRELSDSVGGAIDDLLFPRDDVTTNRDTSFNNIVNILTDGGLDGLAAHDFAMNELERRAGSELANLPHVGHLISRSYETFVPKQLQNKLEGSNGLMAGGVQLALFAAQMNGTLTEAQAKIGSNVVTAFGPNANKFDLKDTSNISFIQQMAADPMHVNLVRFGSPLTSTTSNENVVNDYLKNELGQSEAQINQYYESQGLDPQYAETDAGALKAVAGFAKALGTGAYKTAKEINLVYKKYLGGEVAQNVIKLGIQSSSLGYLSVGGAAIPLSVLIYPALKNLSNILTPKDGQEVRDILSEDRIFGLLDKVPEGQELTLQDMTILSGELPAPVEGMANILDLAANPIKLVENLYDNVITPIPIVGDVLANPFGIFGPKDRENPTPAEVAAQNELITQAAYNQLAEDVLNATPEQLQEYLDRTSDVPETYEELVKKIDNYYDEQFPEIVNEQGLPTRVNGGNTNAEELYNADGSVYDSSLQFDDDGNMLPPTQGLTRDEYLQSVYDAGDNFTNAANNLFPGGSVDIIGDKGGAFGGGSGESDEARARRMARYGSGFGSNIVDDGSGQRNADGTAYNPFESEEERNTRLEAEAMADAQAGADAQNANGDWNNGGEGVSQDWLDSMGIDLTPAEWAEMEAEGAAAAAADFGSNIVDDGSGPRNEDGTPYNPFESPEEREARLEAEGMAQALKDYNPDGDGDYGGPTQSQLDDMLPGESLDDYYLRTYRQGEDDGNGGEGPTEQELRDMGWDPDDGAWGQTGPGLNDDDTWTPAYGDEWSEETPNEITMYDSNGEPYTAYANEDGVRAQAGYEQGGTFDQDGNYTEPNYDGGVTNTQSNEPGSGFTNVPDDPSTRSNFNDTVERHPDTVQDSSTNASNSDVANARREQEERDEQREQQENNNNNSGGGSSGGGSSVSSGGGSIDQKTIDNALAAADAAKTTLANTNANVSTSTNTNANVNTSIAGGANANTSIANGAASGNANTGIANGAREDGRGFQGYDWIYPSDVPLGAGVFKEADLNRDGVISFDDFKRRYSGSANGGLHSSIEPAVRAQFDKIDANRDGTVTVAEMAAKGMTVNINPEYTGPTSWYVDETSDGTLYTGPTDEVFTNLSERKEGESGIFYDEIRDIHVSIDNINTTGVTEPNTDLSFDDFDNDPQYREYIETETVRLMNEEGMSRNEAFARAAYAAWSQYTGVSFDNNSGTDGTTGTGTITANEERANAEGITYLSDRQEDQFGTFYDSVNDTFISIDPRKPDKTTVTKDNTQGNNQNTQVTDQNTQVTDQNTAGNNADVTGNNNSVITGESQEAKFNRLLGEGATITEAYAQVYGGASETGTSTTPVINTNATGDPTYTDADLNLPPQFTTGGPGGTGSGEVGYGESYDPIFGLLEVIYGTEIANRYKGGGLAQVDAQNLIDRYTRQINKLAFDRTATLAGEEQGLVNDLREIQRGNDLGLLQDYGPQYAAALYNTDPIASNQLLQQNTMSNRLYDEAEGNFSESRQAQITEDAFQTSALQGRERDPSMLYERLIGSEDARANREARAQVAGGNTFNMSRNFTDQIPNLLLGAGSSPYERGVGTISPPYGTVDAAGAAQQNYQNNQNFLDNARAQAALVDARKQAEADNDLTLLEEVNYVLDQFNTGKQTATAVLDTLSGFGGAVGGIADAMRKVGIPGAGAVDAVGAAATAVSGFGNKAVDALPGGNENAQTAAPVNTNTQTPVNTNTQAVTTATVPVNTNTFGTAPLPATTYDPNSQFNINSFGTAAGAAETVIDYTSSLANGAFGTNNAGDLLTGNSSPADIFAVDPMTGNLLNPGGNGLNTPYNINQNQSSSSNPILSGANTLMDGTIDLGQTLIGAGKDALSTGGNIALGAGGAVVGGAVDVVKATAGVTMDVVEVAADTAVAVWDTVWGFFFDD